MSDDDIVLADTRYTSKRPKVKLVEDFVEADLHGRGFKGAFPGVQDPEAMINGMAKAKTEALAKKEMDGLAGEFISYDVYGRADPRVFFKGSELVNKQYATERMFTLRKQMMAQKKELKIAPGHPRLTGASAVAEAEKSRVEAMVKDIRAKKQAIKDEEAALLLEANRVEAERRAAERSKLQMEERAQEIKDSAEFQSAAASMSAVEPTVEPSAAPAPAPVIRAAPKVPPGSVISKLMRSFELDENEQLTRREKAELSGADNDAPGPTTTAVVMPGSPPSGVVARLKRSFEGSDEVDADDTKEEPVAQSTPIEVKVSEEAVAADAEAAPKATAAPTGLIARLKKSFEVAEGEERPAPDDEPSMPEEVADPLKAEPAEPLELVTEEPQPPLEASTGVPPDAPVEAPQVPTTAPAGVEPAAAVESKPAAPVVDADEPTVPAVAREATEEDLVEIVDEVVDEVVDDDDDVVEVDVDEEIIGLDGAAADPVGVSAAPAAPGAVATEAEPVAGSTSVQATAVDEPPQPVPA